MQRAVQVFQELGHHVDLFPTHAPNTAGAIARTALEQGATCIVAAGGDGTINEVISGLAHSDAPLGILPAGTANVLAAEVGLSKNLSIAAKQLCECSPQRVPLGKVTVPGRSDRYFLLMAGVGLDAAIIYDLDLPLKQKLGKLAYWHGGFRQLGRDVSRFKIAVNGREHLASFVLATRVRNYGGDFEIARKVRLTDREFEIVVFQNQTPWGYLRFFASIVLNRLERTKDVVIYRSSEMELYAPEDGRIYVQADGEAVGHLPCKVETVPDSLTLLLPEKYMNQR